MPFNAMLAAKLLPGLMGGKQVGAPAPAFQPGQQQAPLGLLGPSQAPVNPGQQAIGGIDQAITTPASEQMGPTEVGPPEPQQQGLLGGFFNNMDQNLQSPSKVIGLGLLNRIDPRLGGAGLLASGLFGGK